MARTSPYEAQLHEACRLVSEAAGHSDWCLVYQSRSGPPTQPWLEPDVCAYLRDVHSQGEVAGIVLAPIGFISDHMEVIYDLDTEARQLCDLLAMPMVRAATVGTHPQFIEMVRNLIVERVNAGRYAADGRRLSSRLLRRSPRPTDRNGVKRPNYRLGDGKSDESESGTRRPKSVTRMSEALRPRVSSELGSQRGGACRGHRLN
jgi:hypothetical protein